MAHAGAYDGDHADRESLYTETPADGYFNRRDHPQDNFVQNPQIESSAGAAKACEAAEAEDGAESEASSIRSSWSDETASLLIQDAGPAPPDYAAATANRANEYSSCNSGPGSAAPVEPEPVQETQLPSTEYGTVEPQSALMEQQQHRQPTQGPDRNWPFGGQSPFGGNFPFGRHDTGPDLNWPFGGQNPFGGIFPFARSDENKSKQCQRRNEQRMSDVHDVEPAEHTALLGHKKLKWRARHRSRHWKRRCCNVMCILIGLLSLLVLALIALLAKVTHETGRGSGRHGDAGRDDDGRHPIFSPNSSNPIIHHPDTMQCRFDEVSETAKFELKDIANFAFIEMLEQTTPFYGGISGNVWIHPAPTEQDQDIVTWVSYATTSPYRVTDITFNSWGGGEGIELEWPVIERLSDDHRNRACINLQVHVYVKRELSMKDWTISSANLEIHAEEGIFGVDSLDAAQSSSEGLKLNGKSSFNAVKGNVDLAYWSSRKTIVDTISGSVIGKYALRDLLSINTRSGGIDVTVDPREEDPNNPVSYPTFTSKSISGDTSVMFPHISGAGIPVRAYESTIETDSGQILGNYYLGHSTSFSTVSGGLSAHVLPIITSNSHSTTLRTDLKSGDTLLQILSPYQKSGEPFTTLSSTHRGISGKLQLSYPEEWEGKLDAKSTSGSIEFSGRGLSKHTNLNWPGNRHVTGSKGNGKNVVTMNTISGTIDFRVPV
ncbi:Hypothetical protein R9X50_00420300 [Acrodontium crateriforme]|uniref:DUF4097 domain-containing protein n=1 Tax=Acrodontium crateriforme TaxID=150365 RepID=A0AAQ3M7K4_9PEZI|nr:Hypothetical protein R9X50_00420300 [Acrodontium crateriforme]